MAAGPGVGHAVSMEFAGGNVKSRGMFRSLAVAAVRRAVLASRESAARDWISHPPRGLRETACVAALAALVLSGIAVARGDTIWAVAAVAAVVVVIFCAPPWARGLGPLLLIAIGVTGLLSTKAESRHFGQFFPSGRDLASWQAALLSQSVAFVAAGLGLMVWLVVRRRIRTADGDGRRLRWGLLAAPVIATLIVLADHHSEQQAWPVVGVGMVLALLAAIGFPRPATAVATAGLFVLGLLGLVYAGAPPDYQSGALLVRHQPLSGVVSGLPSAPVIAVRFWSPVTGPMPLMGAVEAGVLLAFALWLVPRAAAPYLQALGIGPVAELAGRVERLTQTRADAVDTAAAELRRVERDLHDGAQARLVALGMSLRAAERLIPTSPDAAIALVAEARETSSKALTELRDLVRGIYPPVLADRGLADAVRALALDAPVRTETDIDLPGRLDVPVESACYFAIAEALANAVKHSGGRVVHIRVRHSPARPHPRGSAIPGVLRIEVTDDGSGGADPVRGTGLAGVERRLGTFDGILAVSSPPGGPTMIIMEIPCALSSPRTSSC
jgi:signal transduction histidine kinase